MNFSVYYLSEIERIHMKLLYGVQATGNGHITRSRIMVSKLKEAGHDVHVIFSGRDKDDLWDVESFHPFTVYRGLTFATDKGRIKYIQTAKDIRLIQWLKDVNQFPVDGIDLVITDFEPVSAYIAKKHGLPTIGIGHQYAFSYDIPLLGHNPVTRWIMKIFGPAEIHIGLHWYHFDQPIFPPVIPTMQPGEVDPKKTLVYLPFENQSDMVKLLAPFNTFQFHIFTEYEVEHDHDHIIVRPLSREDFLNELMTCKGVITNAGFELPSEALSLGKKILVKPLKGQMEQMSNMEAMRRLGWGMGVEVLSADIISEWLDQDGIDPIAYPDVAQMITDWIGDGNWTQESIESLSAEVWSAFQLPPIRGTR